ncbi:MAG: YceI family protein [Thermoanaerobaculia bacterium]
MKSCSLILTLSLLVLPACKSEIDNKPAAEVSAASSDTTPTSTQSAAATTSSAPVIKEKSKIEFVAAKVTRDHHGQFKAFDGRIDYAGTQPARISFDIDLNSVETDTEKLTGHLKTADFFDVAKYPKATFTSTSIAPAPAGSPNGTTHILKGTLDLHGTTKDIEIPVIAQQTADGVHTTSEFTINRQDWGISYRGAADDLIKDNVLIKLDLMFPPPPTA